MMITSDDKDEDDNDDNKIVLSTHPSPWTNGVMQPLTKYEVIIIVRKADMTAINRSGGTCDPLRPMIGTKRSPTIMAR